MPAAQSLCSIPGANLPGMCAACRGDLHKFLLDGKVWLAELVNPIRGPDGCEAGTAC